MDNSSIVAGESRQPPDARQVPPGADAAAAVPSGRHGLPAPPASAAPVCRDRPLEILYCDDDLVAIAKPSGLLVHRTRLDAWERDCAVARLREQLGRAVHPVHRLDKATSGVLLFAHSAQIRALLGTAFERGLVRKRYLAIVRGWPPPSLSIEHALGRLEDAYDARGGTGAAQPAVTRLTRLATAELDCRVDRYPTSRYALVALEPLTGRRHQLRRHLKHVAHPIIGDTSYGQGRHNRLFRERFGCERLLLAAVSLVLAHPRSQRPLEVHAPPDAAFAAVAAPLGFDRALLAAAARMPPA